jgi:serine/threonine-protein phosphatase 2B catalytic subunit
MSDSDNDSIVETYSSGDEVEDDSDNETLLDQERLKQIYTKDYQLHTPKLPTKERIVSSVEPPVGYLISDEDFWLVENVPNMEKLKDHLRKEGRISYSQMQGLIDLVYEILCEEDNVVYVEAPLTVVGDIHGQYYDLLKLLEIGGDPAKTNYLFLGDYVDRGNFSIECVILLLAYKIVYPETFYLLRGNHECRHVTSYFSFKEECIYKYDTSTYESLMDTFDALPLVAIMNKQFFCTHGGLSPNIESMEDIYAIDRFREPPISGPMCDLLWSDPVEDFDTFVQPTMTYHSQFIPNTVRGCSYYYTYQAALEFLEKNKFLSIIRAHEAQSGGYRMHKRNDRTGFPAVITLFSAPNYLDMHGNKGAILRYENNVFNIRQYNNNPHPYYLPGFMNVFAWSLPFVAEKVAELLVTVFNLVDDIAAEKEENLMRRREIIRHKVITVSKLLILYKKLRDEREALVIAGLLSPKGKELPKTLNSSTDDESKMETVKKTLEDSLEEDTFNGAKILDRPNEARPNGTEELNCSWPLSDQQVKRFASRDRILRSKRNNSLPSSIRHMQKVKGGENIGTPKIKEDNQNVQ